MATDETLHNRFVAASLELLSRQRGNKRTWYVSRGARYGYSLLTLDEATARLKKHGYEEAFATHGKVLVKMISSWLVQVVYIAKSNLPDLIMVEPQTMSEEEWLKVQTSMRRTADILNKEKNTAD